MSLQDGIHGLEENGAFLTDPLTGFGSRQKLIADLAEALEPESPPRTLAVYALAGWKDSRRIFGERATDGLIARLAKAFALVVHPVGACYRSREDEFCVLAGVPDDEDGLTTMLAAAAGTIREEGEAFSISSWFGAVILPDEASDPTEALMLADERVRARMGNREPRERRQNPFRRS